MGNYKEMIDKLLTALDYEGSQGYICESDFANISTSYRYALVNAKKHAKVFGVFGIWAQHKDGKKSFIPLVYIASTENEDDVTSIHKFVWNQGLVPYLLVMTPRNIKVLNGFLYASKRNDGNRPGELETVSLTDSGVNLKTRLSDYSAKKLQSSLFWRDHAIDISGRVDYSLLKNLLELSKLLTRKNASEEDSKIAQISTHEANSLIGKMLYLSFLLDKGIVTSSWLKTNHPKINIDSPLSWKAKDFWHLINHLDTIFNGSIFPLTSKEKSNIRTGHITLVAEILSRADLDDTQNLQYRFDFANYDFSSIQTETLSAVYEQFLSSHGGTSQQDAGAYYTPPFLADYVLDRVSEEVELTDGKKVLDCAAGSGVFLVSAFRRIIESELTYGKNELPLNKLQGLLTKNIFGVERNPDACNVACFSLYLTLLEYASPRDLNLIAKAKGESKIFPPLMKKNIIHEDFFDPKLSCPHDFDVIVGNPPWKRIDKKHDSFAYDYSSKNSKGMPIGDNQLAELFVWKCLKKHLKEGGFCGLILPSKTLHNDFSKKFRNEFFKNSRLVGVADFSNLRHVLFARAIHPSLALFFKNNEPLTTNKIWHYSPLRAEQSVSLAQDKRRKKMWAILGNTRNIKNILYGEVLNSPALWSRLLFQKTVDIEIIDYLDEKISQGTVVTLRDLGQNNNLTISRGGNEPDSGVPGKYILSAKKTSNNHYLNHLECDDGRFGQNKITPLPSRIFKKAKSSYKVKFGGNIVLIPRSLEKSHFLDYPVAYTSSFMSITSKSFNSNTKLLKGLTKYLNSKLVRYYLILTAKRYLIDRPNIELETLKALPVPFFSSSDTNLKRILDASDENVDKEVFKILGINGEYVKAIEEFIDTRIKFKDGGVPSNAMQTASDKQINEYKKQLSLQLDKWFGKKHSYNIDTFKAKEEGLCVISAQYKTVKHSAVGSVVKPPLEAWLKQQIHAGYSPLTSDIKIVRNRKTSHVYLIKPLESMNWTIERTIADSQSIVKTVLDGSRH